MSETPRYELQKPFYVEDRLIPEGAIITFPGVPNEHMVPLNEPAREQMATFISKLKGGRPTPALSDLVYEAMLNRPREADAGGIVVENEKPQIPIMGTVELQGQARPKASALKVEVVPPVDASKKPIQVMGTVQSVPVNAGGE